MDLPVSFSVKLQCEDLEFSDFTSFFLFPSVSGAGDMSMNKSFSEEEAKSTDQLMQIIKYLRNEKAILTGKVEVSRAESIRLKAQLESVQHQFR